MKKDQPKHSFLTDGPNWNKIPTEYIYVVQLPEGWVIASKIPFRKAQNGIWEVDQQQLREAGGALKCLRTVSHYEPLHPEHHSKMWERGDNKICVKQNVAAMTMAVDWVAMGLDPNCLRADHFYDTVKSEVKFPNWIDDLLTKVFECVYNEQTS